MPVQVWAIAMQLNVKILSLSRLYAILLRFLVIQKFHGITFLVWGPKICQIFFQTLTMHVWQPQSSGVEIKAVYFDLCISLF